MTYCPCKKHVVLKIAGIVSNVKLLSLKHKTPSAFSVVLDTYTENPMNRGAKPFPGPEKKTTIENVEKIKRYAFHILPDKNFNFPVSTKICRFSAMQIDK